MSSSHQLERRTMHAMVMKKGWLSSALELQEVEIPQIKKDEVLITVLGVGVNRDDLCAANGVCPGIQCSGLIESFGRNVRNWKVGQRVCTIVDGGAYAEKVVVPASHLLQVPDTVSIEGAACLPYAACNIWLALTKREEDFIMPDEIIMIRDGTCAIGALAIQFAKYKGLKVIATVDRDSDLGRCRDYGADVSINHTKSDFVSSVMRATNGAGVDFVLDYGANRLSENFWCCSIWAKVFITDLHGMKKNSINLAQLVVKHLQVKVVDIRCKSLELRASIIDELRRNIWHAVKNIKFVVHAYYSLMEAQRAHEFMTRNNIMDNIILFNTEKNKDEESTSNRKKSGKAR